MLKKSIISILIILTSFIFLYSSLKNILVSIGISIFAGIVLFILLLFVDKKQKLFIGKFMKGKQFSNYFFINCYLGKNEEESLLLACQKNDLKIENNFKNKASKENILLDLSEEINDEIFNYFVGIISLGTYKNDLLFYRDIINDKYDERFTGISNAIKKRDKNLIQHSMYWLTIFLLIIMLINFLNSSHNVIATHPLMMIVPIFLVLLFMFDVIRIIYLNFHKIKNHGAIINDK